MSPSPQVFLRFQLSFYLFERGGRLIRVPWESDWEIQGEWQNYRLGLTDRRGYSATFCRTLHNGRKEEQPRRNHLRCEFCHELFPNGSALALHSPCPTRYRLKAPGLQVIVELLRKKAWVRTTEIERLRNILLDSLTKQAYRGCLEEFSPVPLFYDPRLPEEENFEHYRLYRFASFVDLLRPGEIDWATPSFSDMQIIRRLSARFLVLPAGPQRKVLRQLLAGRVHLQTLAGIRQRNHFLS